MRDALTPHSTFYEYGLLSRAEITSLEIAGAVGDVPCRFINEQGHIIDHPINKQVLAVSPEELRGTRNIVTMSGGRHKLKVMPAIMFRLRPHVLIVNELLVERLIVG